MKLIGIETITDFKDRCRNIVGFDIGDQFYSFYRNCISAAGAKGGKTSDKKIRHIKFILEKYPIDVILKSMEYVVEDIKAGKTTKSTSVSFSYFEKKLAIVSKSFSTKSFKSKQSGTHTPIKQTIPIKKERVDDHYKDDFYNWIYTCPVCGADIDPWSTKCSCGATCNWKEVC